VHHRRLDRGGGLPEDGTSRADLIRNADLALYASKSDGRGRFKFFSTDLLEAAEDKRALEEDLRDALARGEIEPGLPADRQCPVQQITGVEALLRWNHPTAGRSRPRCSSPSPRKPAWSASSATGRCARRARMRRLAG
jgi:predicted signal transduction protein with EAL and GGDEF domain